MISFREQRRRKIVWAVYVLVLCVTSLMPQELAQAPGSDKLHHFLAYALLVLLWPSGPSLIRIVALAAGLGALLELGQGILPTGRCMEGADAVANTVGACLGAVIIFAWQRLQSSAAARREHS